MDHIRDAQLKKWLEIESPQRLHSVFHRNAGGTVPTLFPPRMERSASTFLNKIQHTELRILA